MGAVEGRVNGMASYLLGINDRNNEAQPTTRAMNTNYVGAFFQDDWKVSLELTLNLGLRWDNERPTTRTRRQDLLLGCQPPVAVSGDPGLQLRGFRESCRPRSGDDSGSRLGTRAESSIRARSC